MIEIEKNVTMPVGGTPWPFNEMEVGDSFAVEKEHLHRLRAAAQHYRSRRDGIKFATRVIGDEIRIWRLS